MSEAKKILMATMQMDIGGAETHILELSRALVRKGYDVSVASNGGAFVSQLEECGIKHYKVPLHSKAPQNVLRSYSLLKRIIKEEGIEIVHAHARIPAFICGLLAKNMKFRFITSAHWVFEVTPLWQRIANWGQRSVAVSEDIKQYLIDNYNMAPDNISVTINGIDTDSFSPHCDATKQKNELSLLDDAKRIVCVSRMDKSRGEVPLMLAKCAESLCKKHGKLEIMLVGGSVLSGEENLLLEIEKIASELNAKLGRQALILTGARTDIKELIATADIFVGVSRAALEAMAEEKPIILAGNEGYLGIFGEDNTEVAIKTNFCCRECAKATEEALEKDIDALLSMSDEQLAELGRYNRSLIIQKYSADKMAYDYIKAYDALPKPTKNTDVIISGYYGFGNTGDESLLYAIVSALRRREPDIGITVLSASPKLTKKHFNVNSVNRINYFAISREMRRASLLISGGGSLLQNATSRKSLAYYLWILKLAKRRGLKIMLYSNGIGPITGERDRKKAAAAVLDADIVTLREPASLSELADMGVQSDRISLSADPAISLERCDDARSEYLLSHLGLNGKKLLAVSLREHSSLDTESFIKETAAAIDSFCSRHSLTPLLIPMQERRDLEICRGVAKLCEGATILPPLSAGELIGLLGRCEFVIGMRLHLLIYALCAGVGVAGISYDPKIDALMQYASMPAPLPLSELNADTLESYLESMYAKKDELASTARAARNTLRKKTDDDAVKALSLASYK